MYTTCLSNRRYDYELFHELLEGILYLVIETNQAETEQCFDQVA